MLWIIGGIVAFFGFAAYANSVNQSERYEEHKRWLEKMKDPKFRKMYYED